MSEGNRGTKAAVLVLVTLPFILTLTMNYFSPLFRDIGLYPKYNGTMQPWIQRNNTRLSVSFAPVPWAFSIWFVIFFYQALLIGYCWSTLFRRASAGGPYLCSDPDLAPNGVLVWHAISSLAGVTWTVLAEWVDTENELRIPQSAALFFYAISLYMCLVYSYWNLYLDKEKLINYNKQLEYWLVVAFVQNGVSMYATWCTIASFLNLNSALVFNAGVDQTTAAVVCLGSVVVVVVAYAIADLTVLDPLTRFVFTPHLVVAWACAGSLVQNFESGSPLTIMTIVLIVLVVLAFIAKFIVIRIRRRTKPIFSTAADEYQMSYKPTF